MPKPHLVLIEDDEWIRALFARTLSPYFEVECVVDAERAIAMIDGGALFDAMLCDLNLRGMSGHDFYDQLEHRSPDLAARLVIITGEEPAVDDAFATILGERYMMKTCKMSELAATLCRGAFPRLSSPRSAAPEQ
jgi:CheY-like chemotaxis protein